MILANRCKKERKKYTAAYISCIITHPSSFIFKVKKKLHFYLADYYIPDLIRHLYL